MRKSVLFLCSFFLVVSLDACKNESSAPTASKPVMTLTIGQYGSVYAPPYVFTLSKSGAGSFEYREKMDGTEYGWGSVTGSTLCITTRDDRIDTRTVNGTAISEITSYTPANEADCWTSSSGLFPDYFYAIDTTSNTVILAFTPLLSTTQNIMKGTLALSGGDVVFTSTHLFSKTSGGWTANTSKSVTLKKTTSESFTAVADVYTASSFYCFDPSGGKLFTKI